MRIHATLASGEACHELHRPMLPTPQLSSKRELQSKTDGSWPDSQHRAWRIWPVRKQTTIPATQPTLSFPHKRKKQTKQQQQMQAITQELYHEVQADCGFGPCPAPHPRTLIMKLEVLLTCWANQPGLVLRSLTRYQQSTLAHSFIIKRGY